MRKWFMPLTVLGLGSLGLLFVSERGQQALHWLADALEGAPDTHSGWNDPTQRELERIEAALDEIAETLQAAG